MYLCILDHAGNIVLHKEVPAEPGAFLEAIAPYRDGLVVACECLFSPMSKVRIHSLVAA